MICLIKCVTVFTACHLCSLLLTLLITCLISDHVVTTCHFLLSKRFCLKIVSLRELSLSTNSLFLFFFIEYAWHLLLFNTYCLCHFIVFVISIILIVLCSCSWNSVRMSLKSIKGNLLTYLLTYLFIIDIGRQRSEPADYGEPVPTNQRVESATHNMERPMQYEYSNEPEDSDEDEDDERSYVNELILQRSRNRHPAFSDDQQHSDHGGVSKSTDSTVRTPSTYLCNCVNSSVILALWGPVLSDACISNVQCHKGITYRFQFLTFGHSGAQGWAPECPNVRNWKWWVRSVWHNVTIEELGFKGLIRGSFWGKNVRRQLALKGRQSPVVVMLVSASDWRAQLTDSLKRGYTWNKIIWNNFEIVSVFFYFTCSHWRWLRCEIKLFPYFISHVTASVWNWNKNIKADWMSFEIVSATLNMLKNIHELQ